LPATPGELVMLHGLLSSPYPAMKAKGEEMMQAIIARHAGLLEAPKNMQWDQAQGRYAPLPGTETRQLPGQSPSDSAQMDAFGNITHGSIPGVQGAVPEGKVYVNGQYVDVAGGQARALTTPQERAAAGIAPDDRGAYFLKPDGTTTPGASQPWSVDRQAAMRQELAGNAQFNESREAAKAYGAMTQLAQQPSGGMRAYALRDTFARVINPKGAVRLGTIQAIAETQGLPADVKGFLMNLKGDGPVPPEIVQQILDAALPFARENYSIAQGMNQSNADLAGRHNFDPRDVTLDIGDAPQPFNLAAWQAAQHPQGGPATPPPPAGDWQHDPRVAAAMLQARGYKLVNGRWTK
jgi:hypothetical protein